MTPLPDQRHEFTRTIVELRAQAAHDDAYCKQFTRQGRFFTGRIAEITESGIDDGVFRAVDADAVAIYVVIINGAMTQRVTTENETATPSATRPIPISGRSCWRMSEGLFRGKPSQNV